MNCFFLDIIYYTIFCNNYCVLFCIRLYRICAHVIIDSYCSVHTYIYTYISTYCTCIYTYMYTYPQKMHA